VSPIGLRLRELQSPWRGVSHARRVAVETGAGPARDTRAETREALRGVWALRVGRARAAAAHSCWDFARPECSACQLKREDKRLFDS